MAKKPNQAHCSFCHKLHDEVLKLIGGQDRGGKVVYGPAR